MAPKAGMFEDLMECTFVEQKCAPRYFATICSVCYNLMKVDKKVCLSFVLLAFLGYCSSDRYIC